MFIGRKRELRWLDEQYRSKRFELSILYGRRRVGKTSLIREFIKDKKAIYFLATQAGDETNLQFLSQSIIHTLHPGMDLAPFATFDAAFQYVAQASRDERLVFVIDEYPYLAQSGEGISSRLQRAIDLYFQGGLGMIILCGSSMHFMEQQVLQEKSPLYGRRTAQMKILPFTFAECCQYLRGLKSEDIAVYYGITGGVAEYLGFIDTDLPLSGNIIRLFFEGRGRLYEEPANLLNQELRDPRVYNDVLAAIAGGASKHNEIATKAGLSVVSLHPYLKTLMELQIARKEFPPGSQGSSKPIYRMGDLMYRFWYRFVSQGRSLVETGQGMAYYEQAVQPMLPDYMGEVFERIVLEYMQLANARGRFPELLTEMGRWWGTDRELKRSVEIDFVGLSTTHAVVGEAKWTHERVGSGLYRDLVQKSRWIAGVKQYYLFSRNGFTMDLVKESRQDPNLRLVDLPAMMSTFEEGG